MNKQDYKIVQVKTTVPMVALYMSYLKTEMCMPFAKQRYVQKENAYTRLLSRLHIQHKSSAPLLATAEI